MNLSGNLLGVTGDDSNEKANKQMIKQFFRSKISQLNQVWSLWNFQEILLWVSEDDSNKKQKIACEFTMYQPS